MFQRGGLVRPVTPNAISARDDTTEKPRDSVYNRVAVGEPPVHLPTRSEGTFNATRWVRRRSSVVKMVYLTRLGDRRVTVLRHHRYEFECDEPRKVPLSWAMPLVNPMAHRYWIFRHGLTRKGLTGRVQPIPGTRVSLQSGSVVYRGTTGRVV